MKRLLLAVALTASVGCSSLLALNPLPGQDAEIRRASARIADGLAVVNVSLDATGETLDKLPLSVAQKDAFDCGILRLTGHDLPSVAVTKTCGTIPSKTDAPIGVALKALRTVSSKPGLCGTVQAVLGALEPVLSRLEAAGVSVAVLRTALTFTVRFSAGCG